MKKRHPHKDNILLVNITRLGDMLQATPTIAGMKQENPNCKITVVVEKQFAEVCRILPNIDEVVGVDLSICVRGLARGQEGLVDAYEYLSEIVKDLKAKNFDYCLNMSSSAYTALLLRLVGVPRRGGWSSDDEGHRVIESEWAQLFASSIFHQNRQYNSLNLVDVFRCSADVDQHPNSLLITIEPEAKEYCEKMLAEAGFTNTGPLICVQAGASQEKRQWAPAHFVKMIKILTEQHNARVVLTGTKKELSIIDPVKQGCNSPNVFVAAGKTNIPQLSALLNLSDVLVTGDTGPMHMSVAAGTPVVAMFLASAFGCETGPYSAGNIVLQPVIACGPCNPNKACARPDCHDHISPELMAQLTMMRVNGEVKEIPKGMADPNKVIVYRTVFDEFGFYDMLPLNVENKTSMQRYRDAYRKLWLSDLGEFPVSQAAKPKGSALQIIETEMDGLVDVMSRAEKGVQVIEELKRAITDTTVSPHRLGELNETMGKLDREIEELGFHHAALGPLTRMFIFGKENLSGSEALDLASQMGVNYRALARRSRKLAEFYQGDTRMN